MIYPDYGSYLSSQGISRETVVCYDDVPVTELSVLGRDLFGFTTNIGPLQGVEYCVSFDFDGAVLNQILGRLSTIEGKINEFIARSDRIGTTVEFTEPIRIHVEARLGELQHAEPEDFVPLVITRIS